MIKTNNLATITVVLLLVSLFNLSCLSLVNAEKDFCYDQVGDGHRCFERENRCEKVQKHDEIAESPCYYDD